MKVRTAGFTVIEMMLAITVLGILTTIAVAPIRDSMAREAVRGARMTTATHVARARSAASTRGCAAVLHFASDGQIWVTACAVNQNAIDTVGTVDDLDTRFEVQFSASEDSVVFQPTGMMTSTGTLQIAFQRGDISDSLGVSPVGRLLW